MATYEGSAFAERFGPWALVAGASDGIGEAFAHDAARRGLHVVLLARRQAVLEKVAADIRGAHGVETRTVVADLTHADLADRVAAGTDGLEIGLLVYNAGAEHGVGTFLDRPLEHARTLIDLNCHGPATLAHLLGQPMKSRGRGGMVFMSSMAALAGSAFIAVYAATKSFDVIFAEALWQELQGEGIDVLSVLGGATDTPAMRRSIPGFDEQADLHQPADVARGALDNLGAGPTYVPGEANRQAAAYLWPVSRPDVSTMMSTATASLYGLTPTKAAGAGFADLA